MYTNAGIHLARTGSFAVPETVRAIVGEPMARRIFASVRFIGTGPFIRLPGGLLAGDLVTAPVYPAFFPLLTVWTGLAAAAGGPEVVPAVAPTFAALALAAVTLFVVDSLGLVGGAIAALFFGANFVLWWFGRFAMPETLACGFLWGGLVFLRRGEPMGAGFLFGLACLARTETMVLLAPAGALWAAFERERPALARILIGSAPPLVLLVATTVILPNHHFGYLMNELVGSLTLVWPEAFWWWVQGRLFWTACVLVAMTGLGVLILVATRAVVRSYLQGQAGRRAVHLLTMTIVVVLVGAHVLLSAETTTLRSVEWLATYCTWPVLVVAVAGIPVLWRSTGPAGRLLVIVTILAAVVLGTNPRVNPFQPWAMRRFLTFVLPGIAVAAAAAFTVVARRGFILALVGFVVAGALAARAGSPILAARAQPYFEGVYASVAALAALFPPDAVVVIDAQFADLQPQVPLWLGHGRETLVLPDVELIWQEVMSLLVASRRPVYWVTNRYGFHPSLLRFRAERLQVEPRILVRLPDAPASTPPSGVVNLLAPLQVYLLSTGDGVGSVR